jgi:hypothetical protein
MSIYIFFIFFCSCKWHKNASFTLYCQKTMRILSIFVFVLFFRVFLHLTFVRGISESRQQQIWNQHKILRFLDTHIDIFQEKNVLGHNSTFCNLKMQMRKNGTFSNILQKVKSCFFANIYHSPCDSYWNSKKSIKLKPPSAQAPLPPSPPPTGRAGQRPPTPIHRTPPSPK